MGGCVPGHSLQRLRRVDELPDPLFLLIHIPEGLRETQGVFQRHMEVSGAAGNLFRDHIHFRVGQVHHPAHVPDHRTGRHGAKGDNLGHAVLSVLPADILHHLAPAGIAEIHVNIRHTDPLRVQEPLKVQAVLDRVYVRDFQAVGDHGPGGASPSRPHGNPRLPGEADKVGHNQKVVRKAHFLYHVLLIP